MEDQHYLWSNRYPFPFTPPPLSSIVPVMGSLVRPGYFLGFYFWLDAIATSSLLFEVPSVKASILGMR